MLDNQYNLIALIIIGIFIQMVMEILVVQSTMHLHQEELLPLVQEQTYLSLRERKTLEVLMRNYTSLELQFQKNLIMLRIQKKDLLFKNQDPLLQEVMQTSLFQRLVVLTMIINVIKDLSAHVLKHLMLLQQSQSYHMIQMLVIKLL